MKKNPYLGLPGSAFWKTGVAQENPYAIEGIYKKKFDISADAKIATAGSCFAQHISHYLKKNGYNVLDVEPPPPGLPESLHQKFGYSMYSARYGNIYTISQLLQLAQEVAGQWTPQNVVWEKDGMYFDALRPAVEPGGLDSPEKVLEDRIIHVSRVKELFKNFDLFVFTLGLTETWIHKDSGTVYPTAPGSLVGEFDENIYEFKNAQFRDMIMDFNKFQKVLKKIRGGKPFKILLTVSPVPLTATASGKHVLVSTVYSKSMLRSVAGQLTANKSYIDYFPSYELVTNPRLHSTSFSDNLRSVRDETVQSVMKHFFEEHKSHLVSSSYLSSDNDKPDIQCEESIIELALASGESSKSAMLLIGNSHSNQLITCLSRDLEISSKYQLSRIHQRALCFNYQELIWNSEECFKKALGPRVDLIDMLHSNFFSYNKKRVVFIGLNLWGDGLVRLFGKLRTDVVNGEVKMVEKPFIPIISHVQECPSHIMQSMERQVQNLSLYLRRCMEFYPEIDFTWCSAPAIPEKVARSLFGSEYVDSNAHSIYNSLYESFVMQYAQDLLDSRKIIISDSKSRAETGFLFDSYAEYNSSVDIHANNLFYVDQVIPRLMI